MSVAQTGAAIPITETSETVVLVVRSASGTCWYVWTDGTVPWYGAETNQRGCTAGQATGHPVAGPVSSTVIGWAEGTYPAA